MILDDFKDRDGKWVLYIWKKPDTRIFTQAGALWNNLQVRCLKGGSVQTARKTYAGCRHTFKDFQDFAEWCQTQVGYAQGFQLDKDIANKGNKLYSKETCFFIPKELNILFTLRPLYRGTLPIGVHLKKKSGRYGATLNKRGKLTYLGYYSTPEEAFLVYKHEKEKLIKEMANEYRSVIDPRAYECLMNYKIEETD